MRLASPPSRPVLLLLFAVATVGATALPLLPVWREEKKPPPPVAAPPPAGETTDQTLVIDLRDDVDRDALREIETRHGIGLAFNSIHAEDDKLLRGTVPAGRDAARLLAALRGDPRVEAAEPELVLTLPEPPVTQATTLSGGKPPRASASGFVPNDPRYPEQWNLHLIGAERAWERTRGRGVIVAVIDTGVAATDSPRGRRARDFGRTRFAAGYDFVHDDDDPYDDNGHGTHVAGTVAESTNNGEGVAGLAFEASILPLKVLTAEGWGTSADIADAIRLAADRGAKVINLSLGGPTPSAIIHIAVKYARRKGVVIVCAAGNGFGEPVGYPAAFRECLAVSSVGPAGELAFYSSYGRELALAAPGGDMESGGMEGGILQNTVWPESQGGRGDDYYHFQGTSMASPHVAAAAALVIAQGVRDPARVRDILVRSATPKPPRLKYGAGILSADRATTAALEQEQAASTKRWSLLAPFAALLLLGRRNRLIFRLGTLGAFGAGFVGPDLFAEQIGADSAWNLLAFSALLPFLLFWELEDRQGSKLVAALALGVALCLGGSLLTGTGPFTASAFGQRALPWTVANTGAALLLAFAAWRRGRP